MVRRDNMRVLAGIVVLLPLLVGSGEARLAPEQPGVEECPFPFDSNLVEGKLLGWLQVEVGRPVAHTRTWHDPDGDGAVVEIVKGPPHATLVNKSKIGSYTLLWTPQEPMVTAIVVRVTDKPIAGTPKSDTGTILIQVLPRERHQALRFCGGPPQ
jgi:hypothetical protein